MTVFLLLAIQQCDWWCSQAHRGMGAVQYSKRALCTSNGICVSAWFQHVALTITEDQAYINECSLFPGGTDGACVCLSVSVSVCARKENKTQWKQCVSICSACLYSMCTKRSVRDWGVESIRIKLSSKCRQLTAHHVPQILKWPPKEWKTLLKFLVISWTTPWIHTQQSSQLSEGRQKPVV